MTDGSADARTPQSVNRRGYIPNALGIAMMIAGLGGTGYGVAQSNVTRGEADRGIASRNRYEDQMQHCQERVDSLLLLLAKKS